MKSFPFLSSVLVRFLCLISIYFTPTGAQSQSLELYNTNSQKSKAIVNPQDVIIYTRNPKMPETRGELFYHTDSTILINNVEVHLNEITAIKAITPTSQMLGYIFAGASALCLTAGIILVTNASGPSSFLNYLAEVFGTGYIVIGAGAAVPAIRYLFFGKKYRKVSGWVLRVPGP